jgi:hypothetical protein
MGGYAKIATPKIKNRFLGEGLKIAFFNTLLSKTIDTFR